eukprot:CAMPEP_0205799414 /NCGR_PEP_ID=MMETSP0205-20121125/673_1 /ASSEMBLY_ACC=CAM_ASM_000278 /TAXON_ID=36767 /ORGANISM="Euplotes focardii, Strain TN1" /LENGTH=77 /DNA_ID=CAMNT_0053060679 /DNA_START=689 /DNA_END=919 /DNA_ORIENTATION=-
MHTFTGQYNYAIDDQFYDGFYLDKDKYLYAYGGKGIQKFDLVLKRWQKVSLKDDMKDKDHVNNDVNDDSFQGDSESD